MRFSIQETCSRCAARALEFAHGKIVNHAE
jgi:hypothetical protein